MDVSLYKKLLEKIIPLCDDIAFGRKPTSDELYIYTDTNKMPDDVARLAEAFGFMTVKLDIREEHTKRLIAELTQKNEELELIKSKIEEENSKLINLVQSGNSSKTIIGNSGVMLATLKMAQAVANRPVNTMLLGETGTGKEKFAKFIHFNSARCKAPFIAVNCSAIPESLFESEMFGIEKGVATGVLQKKGLLEEAHGGTIFLDEVTDMPLSQQSKLLRALEEQEIVRVGSSKPIPVDIKVISAANIDIDEAVTEKKFRMDLFYRLNVAEIRIPPLRDRGEDIIILAIQFLKKHCAEMKQKELILLPKTREALLQYDWPGNVRELNNEMERIVALSYDDEIDVQHLSSKIVNTCGVSKLNNVHQVVEQVSANIATKNLQNFNLSDIEKQYICAALVQTQGNRTKAAQLLGITREGLRKKLLRFNLEDE